MCANFSRKATTHACKLRPFGLRGVLCAKRSPLGTPAPPYAGLMVLQVVELVSVLPAFASLACSAFAPYPDSWRAGAAVSLSVGVYLGLVVRYSLTLGQVSPGPARSAAACVVAIGSIAIAVENVSRPTASLWVHGVVALVTVLSIETFGRK